MKRKEVNTTTKLSLDTEAAIPSSPIFGIKAVIDDGSEEADTEMERELSGDPDHPEIPAKGIVLRVSPILASRLNNTSARRTVEDCVVCVGLRCEPSVIRAGKIDPDDAVDAIQRAVLTTGAPAFKVGDGEIATKLVDEKGLYTVAVFFTASITT